MQERFVTPPETAAVVLRRFRRNRRISEAWVAFNVWRPSRVNVAVGGSPSIVKTLPGDFLELWRRRWLIVNRMRMRTSSNGERQREGCKGKPFFHIVSLLLYLMSRQIRRT